jgi:branched-chain amino acid transport system ATP-binding protein
MAASTGCCEERAVTEPLLQVDNLSKRFGGVVASDAITLDVPVGEFHAIIGPNGAGKSTLIGLLAGEIAPQGGAIRFDGGDISRLPVHRRSQLGLARSFQITSLFGDFTALDNVALAVQAHSGHSFRFWTDARRQTELRAPARAALDRVGLGARADIRVDRLSHGEQRQLEIAMALATEPRLLLLDEPMAGMGPDESVRMVELLRALKGGITILLIEHDMATVFALADRITVLVYGRVIASGDPAAIKADAAVREAYLGEPASGTRAGTHGSTNGSSHG